MPAIRVEDLIHAYADGPRALDGVTFTIEEGETVGLVGPNGAGKTTLFLCLSGVLAASGGKISIAGLDPTDPSQRRQLPAKVGIVFQDSNDQLFNATVFDDVAFGPLNLELPAQEIKARVAEALMRVGLQGFEERVPFHLSAGEKKRVALAGILAMRPDILLLDEPSAGLDPRGRRELIQLIKDLSGSKIIAAHDLELIREVCGRTILLDAGRASAAGVTDDLLADEKLMAAHGLEVPYSLRT